MRNNLAFVAILSLSVCHLPVWATHCTEILAEVREHSRTLSLEQFDQTPGGGWRALSSKGCHIEASTLIANYAEHNGWTESLQWHQLQMFAIAGDYKSAISMGEQILAAEPTTATNSPFLWQEYVAGTVAFLKNDEAGLHYYRDKLAAGSDFKPNAMNLRVLDRLAEDLTRSYQEAYSGQKSEN